jgi:aspartyl-tRNA synthetase
MVFIDLRDREGLVQLKFDPQTDPQAHELAGRLRSEYCICVRGEVAARPEGMVNPNLSTGQVEVNVREIDVLSSSETPRFEVSDEVTVRDEELRLEYRFLDLRRPAMQRALRTRHRAVKIIRDYFDELGFIEIETPFLTRSTPEGARDFLVPSRKQPGRFYALPQSPQLFKQLLMISGFDRYMQIVRCFRDEDSRRDRQPEFTQLDVEMSFVQVDDVLEVAEGCLTRVWRQILGVDLPRPFPRMSYAQALADYGIDRPDTRYGLKIRDVTEICRRTDFRVFTSAIEKGGVVRCICVPGGAEIPQSEIEKADNSLQAILRGIGAGGLPYVKVERPAGTEALHLKTGCARFFSPERAAELCTATEAQPGDAIFFAADTPANVCRFLARLREEIARRRKLIPPGLWHFVWIVDFPLLEHDPQEGRYCAVHHPFTAPRDEDVPLLESEPLKVRAQAYDVVVNGVELAGGSIRIHRAEVQQKIFRLLGLSPEQAEQKFGFLLKALRHGPPPHGGFALGVDRMVMALAGLDSLMDTFSFPKTAEGLCPLTQAPAPVETGQLEELGIRIAPRAQG